jgi:hypothetical protein
LLISDCVSHRKNDGYSLPSGPAFQDEKLFEKELAEGEVALMAQARVHDWLPFYVGLKNPSPV